MVPVLLQTDNVPLMVILHKGFSLKLLPPLQCLLNPLLLLQCLLHPLLPLRCLLYPLPPLQCPSAVLAVPTADLSLPGPEGGSAGHQCPRSSRQGPGPCRPGSR